MYQIYLLSVVTNILAGTVASFDGLDEKLHISAVFNRELLDRAGFRLGLGLVTVVVGFLKFLTVSEGDVPVVGDLLPALAGVSLGMILLLQYYKGRSDVSSPAVDKVDNILGKNANVFGMAGVAVAVVHFLFHPVLFL
ncbi:MAG: hypothetical protein ACOCW6_08175 [Spirochaetota bacterium]